MCSNFNGTESTPQQKINYRDKQGSNTMESLQLHSVQKTVADDTTPRIMGRQKESQIRPTRIDSSGIMFSMKNQTGFHHKNRTRFVDNNITSLKKRHSTVKCIEGESVESCLVNNKSSKQNLV